MTTGDAVQAAAGLLAHAAQGLPPLPVAPRAQARPHWGSRSGGPVLVCLLCVACLPNRPSKLLVCASSIASTQVCLVQLPTPPGYFGNAVRQGARVGAAGLQPHACRSSAVRLLLHAQHAARLTPRPDHPPARNDATPPPPQVHMLRVKLPAGTAQPAAGDHAGALRALAGAIRSATAAFRASPEAQLAAIADTEALVGAPAPAMLTWLAAKRMPLLTCTTNYVPAAQVGAVGANLALRGGATSVLLHCQSWQPASCTPRRPWHGLAGRCAGPPHPSLRSPPILPQGIDLGLGRPAALAHYSNPTHPFPPPSPPTQGINLGLDRAPTYTQGLTLPRARNMVRARRSPPLPRGAFRRRQHRPAPARGAGCSRERWEWRLTPRSHLPFIHHCSGGDSPGGGPILGGPLPAAVPVRGPGRACAWGRGSRARRGAAAGGALGGRGVRRRPRLAPPPKA